MCEIECVIVIVREYEYMNVCEFVCEYYECVPM